MRPGEGPDKDRKRVVIVVTSCQREPGKTRSWRIAFAAAVPHLPKRGNAKLPNCVPRACGLAPRAVSCVAHGRSCFGNLHRDRPPPADVTDGTNGRAAAVVLPLPLKFALVRLAIGVRLGIKSFVGSNVAYCARALVRETSERQRLADFKDRMPVHLVPQQRIARRIGGCPVRGCERLILPGHRANSA